MTMASAGPKPETELEIALSDRVTMRFRLIPAGEFRMGQRGERTAEEPVHRVLVPEPFWMAETPVTQAQFEVWTRAEGIEHRNEFAGRPDHPAENMDWHQAVRFCEWLTRTHGGEFPEGCDEARLPDEARWEYACRAGTETEYYSGDGEAALAEVGWYTGNAGEGTRPARKRAANAWGLYDMHGNVWEWCADVYDPRAYRKRKCEQVEGEDRIGWMARAWTMEDAGNDAVYLGSEDRKSKSPNRVLRGGSCFNVAGVCRFAFRFGNRPSVRNWNGGFRVCLARSSPAEEESEKRRSRRREARRGGTTKPSRTARAEPSGLETDPKRRPPSGRAGVRSTDPI